jgi:SAM-dependent methyltransferase
MRLKEEKADYLNANWEFHKSSYASGYGIEYPEGHVIRIYHRVLKYELGYKDQEKGRNFLDFGCGNGTHAFYFQKKGFNVYGVDSDPIAIGICKGRAPEIQANFAVVPPKSDSLNLDPSVKFDVVLCNQVLYYLSDTDLKAWLEVMKNSMKPGGVFIATMMGEENSFYAKSSEASDGLRRVSLQGREQGEFFINFTKDKDDLIRKFNLFKPLHIGFYNTVIREEEGSGLHHLFIGTKA